MMHIRRPYRIGITGGIGTGKSQVSRYLTSLGYPVLDADQLARDVVEPGEIGWMRVVDKFGDAILNSDKTINRRKLGNMIFNDETLRKELNAILHPIIHQRMEHSIEAYPNETFVFMDVPLLFETDSKKNYDEVILVYASEEIALARIVERDQVTEAMALKKIQAQMSIDVKKHLADYVLYNESDIGSLHEEVQNYLKSLYLRLK